MTLAQWQSRFPQSRVPFDQALDVARALGGVFHRAHVDNADHSDIAASAVMVETDEAGALAVRIDTAAALAAAEGLSGTRRYLAPECWRGARQTTYSDQYALAALFVELVTGEVPFAASFATEDADSVRAVVCGQPPDLPADCPRRDVLLRALAKNPHRRFHSCGAFIEALVDPQAALRREREQEAAARGAPPRHGHGHPHAHHGHAAHRMRPAASRRRLPPVVRALGVTLSVLLVGVAAVWTVKSGWIARMLRADDRSTRREAARQAELARDELEALESVRTGAAAPSASPERLAAIEEEINLQRKAADQALHDLQEFLEKGGCALLEVRRDTLQRDLRRVQTERTALEGGAAAARRLEEALTQLRMRAVPYESVASEIPSECEVARSYVALSAASARLDALASKFTDRHPEVVQQKKLVEAARKAYFESVGSSLHRIQGDRSVKAQGIGDFREQEARLARELAKAERECQVARLRQDELEKARSRASQRLADLLRMETRVRFGGAPSSADKPESPAR